MNWKIGISLTLFGIFLLSPLCQVLAQTQSAPFDLIITNGHIIDGTGSPWY